MVVIAIDVVPFRFPCQSKCPMPDPRFLFATGNLGFGYGFEKKFVGALIAATAVVVGGSVWVVSWW